jgi:hypothetical protein
MNRDRNVPIFLLILAVGLPLFAWSGYSLARDTYALWTRGVDKHASIISLDGILTGKAGTRFDYTIEIDGKKSHHEFLTRLRIGETVDLLIVPDDPHTMALANKLSGPYAIFAALIGGVFTATMVLVVFVFVIIATPATLWRVIKGRKI